MELSKTEKPNSDPYVVGVLTVERVVRPQMCREKNFSIAMCLAWLVGSIPIDLRGLKKAEI